MPKKKKPQPRRKKRPLLGKLILIGGSISLAVCVVYAVWAATFDLKGVEIIPQRSGVYDMDGGYYSRLRGENRVVVPIEKVAESFTNALLAREDTRFYKHHGVDPVGILRAIQRNITHLSVKEGASTLTQQLARNSFHLGENDLHRKLLEAFVALRMEQSFTKKEILQHYVNRIYFGSGYWGVETASQAYFGKPAAKMSLSESAMLVGLIRSPNRFSPFNNLKAAMRERDTVLDRMLELKMITAAQAKAAKNAKVSVAKRRGPYPQENYAMDAVIRDLDVLLRDEQLDEGGLRIYTTIDPDLQRTAHRAVDDHLASIEKRPGYSHPKKSDFSEEAKKNEEETPYLQGAAVVIDNRTGGIRAIVGGRDYTESRYNRALLPAKRQIGSTFKPFVYAAAFAKGMTPDTPVDDGPIQRGELRSVNGGWSPANSDGKYKGRLPAGEGLVESRNTMTVRVGDYAGLRAVEDVAGSVGLGELPPGPAVFLGAFEASLKDLTMAYTVFPNEGVRKQPYIIERIDDEYGNVLYRAAHLQAQALEPRTVLLVSSVLQDVLDRGTGAAARRMGFKKPAGGKTGTTNDFRDAWFVGYTSSLTCGVWAGLDRPATIMNRGYGSTIALPIWTKIMANASDARYPAETLAKVQVARRARESDRRGEEGPSVPEKIFDSFRNLFRRR